MIDRFGEIKKRWKDIWGTKIGDVDQKYLHGTFSQVLLDNEYLISEVEQLRDAIYYGGIILKGGLKKQKKLQKQNTRLQAVAEAADMLCRKREHEITTGFFPELRKLELALNALREGDGE